LVQLEVAHESYFEQQEQIAGIIMELPVSTDYAKAKSIPRLNFFVTLIGFLDTHLLIPVMAFYAAALGAGVSIVGLIIGLYSVSNTFANLVGGRLVDRFGHKAPLIGGLVGDALAMFGYALCQLPWHLALVRIFHGSSGGLVGPATMSVTARHSSAQYRGRGMAFYGMAIAIATLLGYGGGGIIAAQLGYQYVFYIGGLLLIIAVVLAGLMPREPGSPRLRASTGDSLRKIMELLRQKNLRVSYCSIFAQYFAFGGIVALLPLYVKTLEMTAFHVGMLLATFSILFIIIQIPAGRLSDRVGRVKPAALGLLLAGASVVTLPLAGNFAVMAGIMAGYGLGCGLLFPSISALVADAASIEEYGRATGIFHALITIGVSVGAPIMGWIASFLGTRASLSLSGAPLFIALALAMTPYFYRPSKPPKPNRTQNQ
jgi:MFS family permease